MAQLHIALLPRPQAKKMMPSDSLRPSHGVEPRPGQFYGVATPIPQPSPCDRILRSGYRNFSMSPESAGLSLLPCRGAVAERG